MVICRRVGLTIAKEGRDDGIFYAADEAKAVVGVGLTEITPNLCV